MNLFLYYTEKFFLTFDYFAIVGLLILILALLVTSYVWIYMNAYKDFPKKNVIIYMLYFYLLKKCPSNIPARSFAFQEIVALTKRYESEGLCLLWGLKTALLVYGQEATKAFLTEQSCAEKIYEYKILGEYFGTGLVTSSEKVWRQHRRILNPAFPTDALKEKISLFNEHAKILMTNLTEEKEKDIFILDFLKPCTFGIICESMLGLNVNDENKKDFVNRWLDIVTKFMESIIHRLMHPWLYFNFFLYFTRYGRECLKLPQEYLKQVNQSISYLKESVSPTLHEGDSENRKCFAQILLRQHLKDPNFTIQNVRDEIATFLTAGYDTVSYAMMWCLFLLGHHQDVQDIAFNEVESETKGFITYDDVCKLKYLECVIKESLRLYPVIPVFGRRLKKDVQCGKYTVPKHTRVVFFPYTLHRNAEKFPDPEKFDPERFLEENADIRSWEYIPFSGGIRDCIGKKFAMLEMKVILAYILRNFQVTSLDKREDVHLSWDFILAPVEPLRLRITARRKHS